MTKAVTQILTEIDGLSENERQQVRLAILERVPVSDELTREEFAVRAGESFRALDEGETAFRRNP